MRYVVTFFDRTTKRVPLEAARGFMRAMTTGAPVLYRGCVYAGKSIASVRTVFGFYSDKIEEAHRAGQYFCKYGMEHPSRSDCGCRDSRYQEFLTAEERVLLGQWNEKQEDLAMALLISPPADGMPPLPAPGPA